MPDDSISGSLRDLKQQIDQELAKSAKSDLRSSITYCGGCGYEPRAEALAAEIGRELGVRVDLYKTTGGLFEVDFGEDRVFSKLMLGRFPEEGEVLRILKARFGK